MKDKRCNKDEKCPHCRPHNFVSEDTHDSDFCWTRCVNPECECVPIPLSYYMKEVLEKDKK